MAILKILTVTLCILDLKEELSFVLLERDSRIVLKIDRGTHQRSA